MASSVPRDARAVTLVTDALLATDALIVTDSILATDALFVTDPERRQVRYLGPAALEAIKRPFVFIDQIASFRIHRSNRVFSYS